MYTVHFLSKYTNNVYIYFLIVFKCVVHGKTTEKKAYRTPYFIFDL